jgi:hypothetical protein
MRGASMTEEGEENRRFGGAPLAAAGVVRESKSRKAMINIMTKTVRIGRAKRRKVKNGRKDVEHSTEQSTRHKKQETFFLPPKRVPYCLCP